MRKKRNGFLTFCFSCLPGAGQMFLGFMRRGTSLMTIFFGLIVLTSFLQIDSLIFLFPVIWFYAFFDAMNLNSLTPEELQNLEDDFLFVEEIDKAKKLPYHKYKIVIAIVLIVVGLRALLRGLMDIFGNLGFSISWKVSNMIFSTIPQIIVSLLIILAGVWLIRGKKNEMQKLEEFDTSETNESEVDK